MAYVGLTERVGFVPGGVNVGVVRGDSGRAILIDTGVNETNGKKALKSVREEAGLEVAAIVTTHGHADHFGANATVVKRTGARVYAPTFDEIFLKYPILQPVALYAGADPIDALRTPFLLADESPVDEVYGPGTLTIDGVDITVIDLAGHSPGQKGLLVDGVFFCADVVLPESVLQKYRIPYLYSVTQHLLALDVAAAQGCDVAMPGHGPITTDLRSVCDINRRLVIEVAERVLDLVEEPVPAEAVMKGILDAYDAPIVDASGYYLLHPTIFAFLSHLERNRVVAHEIVDRRSLWRRI